MKSKSGFTLVEMMVVVAISVVMVAAGVGSYGAASKKNKDNRRVADIERIKMALEMFKQDDIGGSYPLDAQTALVSGGYLREWPTGPGGVGDTYTYTRTTPYSYLLDANFEVAMPTTAPIPTSTPVATSTPVPTLTPAPTSTLTPTPTPVGGIVYCNNGMDTWECNPGCSCGLYFDECSGCPIIPTATPTSGAAPCAGYGEACYWGTGSIDCCAPYTCQYHDIYEDWCL